MNGRRPGPAPPSKIRPRIPRGLGTICANRLHRASERRYASAHALAVDLRRSLDGMPILARRPPARGRGGSGSAGARRPRRSSPWVGAASIAAVVATLQVKGAARVRSIRDDRRLGEARHAVDGHARQARPLVRLGHHGEALAAAAPAIPPELAEVHRDRVASFLELRRLNDVIGSCDVAPAQGPLGRVARAPRAGPGRPRRPRRRHRHYTQALALRPAWARVLSYRGPAHQMANAHQRSLADSEEVLRLDPPSM